MSNRCQLRDFEHKAPKELLSSDKVRCVWGAYNATSLNAKFSCTFKNVVCFFFFFFHSQGEEIAADFILEEIFFCFSCHCQLSLSETTVKQKHALFSDGAICPVFPQFFFNELVEYNFHLCFSSFFKRNWMILYFCLNILCWTQLWCFQARPNTHHKGEVQKIM